MNNASSTTQTENMYCTIFFLGFNLLISAFSYNTMKHGNEMAISFKCIKKSLHSCHILLSLTFSQLDPCENPLSFVQRCVDWVCFKKIFMYVIRDSTASHMKKILGIVIPTFIAHKNTICKNRKCSVLKLQFFVGPLFFLPYSRCICTPNFSHPSKSIISLSIIFGDTT